MIYIAAHKQFTSLEMDGYIPLQVGAENNIDLGYLKDNVGDNISEKNPNYCELTGLYWIWKNCNDEYKGLVHYRRYFGKSNLKIGPSNIYTYQEMVKMLETADIVLPYLESFKQNAKKEILINCCTPEIFEYSNVFNNYLVILLIGVLGILLIGKPFVIILFENSYNNAYLYIPILIMGVVIHALNGNLGSLYSVFKNTKGALYSTAIGALTNVVLNCIFIPYIGIMGAAITTLIGYIVTLVYRWIDTKKFVSIVLEKKQIFLMTLIVILQAVLYYIPGTASYIIRTIIVLSVLWKYRKVLLSVLKK